MPELEKSKKRKVMLFFAPFPIPSIEIITVGTICSFLTGNVAALWRGSAEEGYSHVF